MRNFLVQVMAIKSTCVVQIVSLVGSSPVLGTDCQAFITDDAMQAACLGELSRARQ